MTTNRLPLLERYADSSLAFVPGLESAVVRVHITFWTGPVLPVLPMILSCSNVKSFQA